MAFWFHPNLQAKFPSLILTGKRELPFPPKNIAPRHPPNHTLLVMRSIFRTGEVGVIRPDHRVWAIILTPPFEPIDLKKKVFPRSLLADKQTDFIVNPGHKKAT